MTTATARSTRLPRRMNCLKSLSMRGSVTLAPDRPWTSRCSSPARPARCPRLGAACPPSCFAVAATSVLFDCGEGTQRQLAAQRRAQRRLDVFLTHFHADHWLGLPGMLKSFELRDRDRPLVVLGPPGTTRLLEPSRFVYGRLSYPFEVRELEQGETVRFDDCDDRPVPASTTRPAPSATRSSRSRGRGASTPSWPSELGVTPGPDFGRMQRGETVAGVDARPGHGPERARAQARPVGRHRAVRDAVAHRRIPGRRARPRGDVRRRGSRARPQTRHSTARQAAELAPRRRGRPARADPPLQPLRGRRDPRRGARGVRETVVPRDFDTIEVPFAEKGEPELVRWDPTGPVAAPPEAAPG